MEQIRDKQAVDAFVAGAIGPLGVRLEPLGKIGLDEAEEAFAVYHAAGAGMTSVRQIAEIVVAAAGRADTQIVYTGGDRGWPGDVPRFRYDVSRLQALGWRPQRESTEAVRHAVERILANGF